MSDEHEELIRQAVLSAGGKAKLAQAMSGHIRDRLLTVRCPRCGTVTGGFFVPVHVPHGTEECVAAQVLDS